MRSRYRWPHPRRLSREIRWWLCRHSNLYRRFVAWRWRRSWRRLNRTIGKQLAPACERAASAIAEWGKAYGAITTTEEER